MVDYTEEMSTAHRAERERIIQQLFAERNQRDKERYGVLKRFTKSSLELEDRLSSFSSQKNKFIDRGLKILEKEDDENLTPRERYEIRKTHSSFFTITMGFINSTKDLFGRPIKYVQEAIRSGYAADTTRYEAILQELQGKIGQIVENLTEGKGVYFFRMLEKVDSLLNKNKIEEICEESTIITREIEGYPIKTSKEKMQEAAKKIISSLDGPKLNGCYFETEEGRVLAYATYKLEAKKEEAKEKPNTEYQRFLNEKAEEKLDLIENRNASNHINSLHQKGFLSEDDSIFLSKNFESKKEEKQIDEDTLLMIDYLQTEYNFTSEKSFEIARLTRLEALDDIITELSPVADSQLIKLLVGKNPDLLIMEKSDLARYRSNFIRLKERANGFEISDFDPYQHPENFATFTAMKGTEKRLEDLIKKAVVIAEKDEDESLEDEENYRLNTEERRDIYSAFKDWRFAPDNRQKSVMRKHNLVYKIGGKHGHFEQEGFGRRVNTALTPGDFRGNRNMAKRIIKMIETNKRELEEKEFEEV